MQYLAVFTGIVEGTGKVKKIGKTKTRSAVGMSIDLGVHSKGLKTGQSVALDGVCLTVIKRVGNTCSFEMIDETAKNTSLGLLKTGDLLNIERSVKDRYAFALIFTFPVPVVKNAGKHPCKILHLVVIKLFPVDRDFSHKMRILWEYFSP